MVSNEERKNFFFQRLLADTESGTTTIMLSGLMDNWESQEAHGLPLFTTFKIRYYINSQINHCLYLYTWCCRKGPVDWRERGGAVARVLLIDGSAAVLSQGCCRSTGARSCCRCRHEIGTPNIIASGNNIIPKAKSQKDWTGSDV